MTSNPGAKTCGAFHRSMANTSPAWRTCLISMPRRPIPSGRSCASTKVRCNSSARFVSQSRTGRLERYDYEYRRNGMVNLFVLLDAHRPWRKGKLTERRTAKDYAKCMRNLVDIHYPD